MTILQLKYVVTIANSSSLREAAGKLFVSQPALSTAIRDLEEELRIRIFERTNKGISLTAEGSEFLNFAKLAVNQFETIEDRYFEKEDGKKYYSVTMQHYVFAVHAFIEAIKNFDAASYSYLINETRTDEVLKSVRDYNSEIGILSYTESNKNLIAKLLKNYELEFHTLMVRDTYVYLSKFHPLADRDTISIEELSDYPCITFDQTNDTDYYLTEEALGGYEFKKLIRTNDRATSFELMSLINGFAVGTGQVVENSILKDEFVSIKLKEEDPLTIGYIVKKNYNLSELGKAYIKELENIIK